MKKARKLITFILTVVMVLSMSMNVWADGETTTGTIKIENAKKDTQYSVYKILELVSFEGDKYSYRVVPEWKTFVDASDFFAVDGDGYVTWTGSSEDDEKATQAATFAQAALAYAQDVSNGISVTATKTATANEELNITGLSLGYYLVDSSLGTLCSLNTTDNIAEITEKNEVPELVKTLEGGDKNNSAKIGDEVKFEITITVKDGAEGYVLHDAMSEGLTYNSNTLLIKVENEDVDLANYTIVDDIEDDCDLEISFSDDYLKTLSEGTEITITYSATLNENAKVGTNQNMNTAYMEYGQKASIDHDNDPSTPNQDVKPTTPEEITRTYTYSFDLVKTDKDDNVIDDANFELYNALTGGEIINLVKVDDDTYRVATPAEVAADSFKSAVIVAGSVTIEGLGNGKYYLQETKAPEGYNPITTRKEIEIKDASWIATVEDDKYISGGVEVENLTGSILPSTGGIGTTIFYIVGGALVLFAVVLLVTKKRMKNEQ